MTCDAPEASFIAQYRLLLPFFANISLASINRSGSVSYIPRSIDDPASMIPNLRFDVSADRK